MNLALAAIYGTEYGTEKRIIRKRIPKMQESISERVEMETNEIEALRRRAEAAEQAEKRAYQAILDVLSPIWSIAKRRLYDPYGDNIEWWEDLAATASRAAGRDISVGELQAVVRRGR